MDCFKCRQKLYPSTDYLIKSADGSTSSVDCVMCINTDCDLVGLESYQDPKSPNCYYHINREIEGMNVTDVVNLLGLKIDSSLDLKPLIDKLKLENPKQVEVHKSGKKDLIGYFMGRLMKEANNQVEPGVARAALEIALKE